MSVGEEGMPTPMLGSREEQEGERHRALSSPWPTSREEEANVPGSVATAITAHVDGASTCVKHSPKCFSHVLSFENNHPAVRFFPIRKTTEPLTFTYGLDTILPSLFHSPVTHTYNSHTHTYTQHSHMTHTHRLIHTHNTHRLIYTLTHSYTHTTHTEDTHTHRLIHTLIHTTHTEDTYTQTHTHTLIYTLTHTIHTVIHTYSYMQAHMTHTLTHNIHT